MKKLFLPYVRLNADIQDIPYSPSCVSYCDYATRLIVAALENVVKGNSEIAGSILIITQIPTLQDFRGHIGDHINTLPLLQYLKNELVATSKEFLANHCNVSKEDISFDFNLGTIKIQVPGKQKPNIEDCYNHIRKHR
ncbi:MAG: hypothetical protein K1X55_13165 [Chitinophagales bacterium]|nr:hypothetical protein [Chitinophagales bacterium]